MCFSGEILSNTGRLIGSCGRCNILVVCALPWFPPFLLSCGSTETLTANYRVKVAGQLVVSSLISLRIVSFNTWHSFPLYTQRTPNTNFHIME